MAGSTWRFLMIGSFTAAPTGRKYPVSGESFTNVMKRMDVRTNVAIPPLLGAEVDEKTFPLHFDRPRMFRAADVIAAIEPLRRLEELAVALTRDRDITPNVAAARVEKIVGPGRLADAIRGVEPPVEDEPETEAATTRSAPPAAATGSALDSIFDKVDTSKVAPASVGKSGLDAFIGAIRSERPRPKIDPQAIRNAAQTIRNALSDVALRILGQPVVARIESCWRGLKMVMAETPGHEDLSVQIVDVDAEADELQLAIERHVSKIDPARPDVVFIAHALAPKTLEWLAEFGADRGVPIVLGVNEALTGRLWHDLDDAAESLEWASLRSHASASYLCAVANPVVLCNEPVPEHPPRLVLGSAAWGLAAMLASAIKRHEDPGAILGRQGALVAPAAHEVEIGMSEPRTIPTAAFAALPQQRRAADHGIVLLGSEAGSDQLIAASATMVAGGATLPERLRQSARGR
jgi:type VI secretion system protein ImpC